MGGGRLAAPRASMPSRVLKGYAGPYGALSPSAISCQLVWGVFGASKRPAWGSRMTPWSCQCSESHLDRSGGIVSPGSPAAANAEL